MADQPFLPAPQKPFRHRYDGLTPELQERFCQALARTGFVARAAKAVGISTTSLYRGRERMPAFAERWDAALATAHGPEDSEPRRSELEQVAWARAVEGVEEPIVRGDKVIGFRRRYSDQMLVKLIEQERGGGGSRRVAPQKPPISDEEVLTALAKRLDAMERQLKRGKARDLVRWAETMEREGKAP